MIARSILAVLSGSAFIAACPPGTSSSQSSAQPVRIGLDGPELDACGGIGKVVRIGLTRERTLAVRGEPAPRGKELARLESGTLVWLCEGADDYQGIVYASGQFQDLGDCRVSSPVREPEDYTGPCKQGWVEAKYIDLVAG